MAEIALSYANVGNAKEAETLIGRARALDKKDVEHRLHGSPDRCADRKIESGGDVTRRCASKITIPPDYAANDPDLDSLHNNPEFIKLMKKYSKKP